MDRTPDRLVERGEAVLVAAPTKTDGPPTEEALDDAARSCVLELSTSQSAAECRRRWVADDEPLPVELAVVEIQPAAGAVDAPPDVAVERAGPDDLTGIGIAINSVLDAWGAVDEFAVRFDSVSVLLQYVETDIAFQFLHTVVARLRSVGARSWFYLNPSLHDQQTTATVAAAFDGRLRRVDDTWRRE